MKPSGIIVIAGQDWKPEAMLLVTDGEIVDMKILSGELALAIANLAGAREKLIAKLQKELNEGKLNGAPIGSSIAELIDDKAEAMAEAKHSTIN